MTYWADSPDKDHSQNVPEHIVKVLASLCPEPRDPARRPDPEQWRKHLEEHARRWWIEAYGAGVARGTAQTLATMSVRYMLVTEEQQAAMRARIEEKATQIIAEIDQKLEELK